MSMSERIEEKIMPGVIKFTSIPIVSAVKDGMIASMPFLVVGSFGLIIKNIPIPGWSDVMATEFASTTLGGALSTWSDTTFNLFTLLSIIAIAYYYAKRLDVDSLIASVLAVVAFAMVTPLSVGVGDQAVGAIPLQWLGSQGLFVGIIMSYLSVKIYKFCIDKNIIIKMPENVPSNVTKAFAAMIPIFFVMTLGFIIRYGVILMGFESFHVLIQDFLGAPLKMLGGSLFGVLTSVFFMTFLWTFGIHGSAIVTGVMNPIWLSLQAENLNAFENGTELPHIVTKTFVDFSKLGGTGFTLPLLLMFMFAAKSKQLKTLGKVSFAPGLFNINEPIIFGAPIVLNPILMIPFVLVPLIATLITYLAMGSGLVPYPTGVVLPWTMPPVIAGFLTNNHWTGAFLQLILIFVGGLVYYPFFKIYDKKLYTEEQNAAKVENAQETSKESKKKITGKDTEFAH